MGFLLIAVSGISKVSANSSSIDIIIKELTFPDELPFALRDNSDRYVAWKIRSHDIEYYDFVSDEFNEIPDDLPLLYCENYDATSFIYIGVEWLVIEGRCGVLPDFIYFYHLPTGEVYQPGTEPQHDDELMHWSHWPEIDDDDNAVWVQDNLSETVKKIFWKDLKKEGFSQEITFTEDRIPILPTIDFPRVVFVEAYSVRRDDFFDFVA